MKIAIIGAGNVGKTLGAALRAKGHTVSYGTRDPANSDERNAKTVPAALSGAEAVILATPWTATESLVCEHADELAGKIVIDATNPINPTPDAACRRLRHVRRRGAPESGPQGDVL